MHNNPLIIQSDSSLMLDTHAELFKEARNAIALFAELEKSPEHFHIYRISSLSIWNAAASGLDYQLIEETLRKYSRYDAPENVFITIKDNFKRYGKLFIEADDNNSEVLYLKVHSDKDTYLLNEIINHKKVKKYFIPHTPHSHLIINPLTRGSIKQEILRLGWPIVDLTPLRAGDPLEVNLKENLVIRDYQADATEAFLGENKLGSGYGVIVLPCGSGKTIVGIDVLSKVKNETLILATNIAAGRQWIREILQKTDITKDMIGEYSGEHKEIKPITVATYQILVWRKDKESPFEHFKLFTKRNWGLIIYDEAHLLPAPVFRITAEIQSVHRLGLTATLVREDGAENDIFTLIGPKRYDTPWRDLEDRGWIAKAYCIEVKVSLSTEDQNKYAFSEKRDKIRIAAENSRKIEVAKILANRHSSESILIIGQYVAQLNTIAKAFNCPIITGKTNNDERERIYEQFRNGSIKVLVVSKVANFSIDLPDASIAIQVSGTFGSRQEEAQRLGRVLRPKDRISYFYSLVTQFTDEEVFNANRQKFLAEQGYAYKIEYEQDIDSE